MDEPEEIMDTHEELEGKGIFKTHNPSPLFIRPIKLADELAETFYYLPSAHCTTWMRRVCGDPSVRSVTCYLEL